MSSRGMVNQSVKALLEGHRYEGPPSEHCKGAPRTTDASRNEGKERREDTQDETRRAIYTSMTMRCDCGRYVCISNELRKESGELILAGPGVGGGSITLRGVVTRGRGRSTHYITHMAPPVPLPPLNRTALRACSPLTGPAFSGEHGRPQRCGKCHPWAR